MATRFEADVESSVPGPWAGLPQRVNFGVGTAVALVPALGDHSSVANDDRAYSRVRFNLARSPARQFETPAHELFMAFHEN